MQLYATILNYIESTTNAEVWYPISDSQIEILENVDLMLFRKLVNVHGHSKTAKEAFFLESGLHPIKFICMKRRLMYLHTVLTRSESEITKSDWYGLVMAERKELMIPQTDVQISKMSKDMFRNVVNNAIEHRALHPKSEKLAKRIYSKRNIC